MWICLPFGHSVPQKEAKDVMIITFFPLHTTIAPAAAALLYYLARQRPAAGAARERDSSFVVSISLPPSRFSLSLFFRSSSSHWIYWDTSSPVLGPDSQTIPMTIVATMTIVTITDNCHHRWRLSPSMTIVTTNDECHYRWVSLPMSVITDEGHYRWRVSLPMTSVIHTH